MSRGALPASFSDLYAWLIKTAEQMCSDSRLRDLAVEETVDAFLETLEEGSVSRPSAWLREALRLRILKQRQARVATLSLSDLSRDELATMRALPEHDALDLEGILYRICADAELTFRQMDVVRCRWRARSVADAAASCGRTVRDARSALREAEKKMRTVLARSRQR